MNLKPSFLHRLRSLLGLDQGEDSESILHTLSRAIEAKDPYTLGHADRVSQYAIELGRSLGVETTPTFIRCQPREDCCTIYRQDRDPRRNFAQAGKIYRRRIYNHETASSPWMRNLPKASIGARRVADHSPSSRTFGRKRISGRVERQFHFPVGAHRHHRGYLRRAAFAPHLQGSIFRRYLLQNHVGRSSAKAAGGTKMFWLRWEKLIRSKNA